MQVLLSTWVASSLSSLNLVGRQYASIRERLMTYGRGEGNPFGEKDLDITIYFRNSLGIFPHLSSSLTDSALKINAVRHFNIHTQSWIGKSRCNSEEKSGEATF